MTFQVFNKGYIQKASYKTGTKKVDKQFNFITPPKYGNKNINEVVNNYTWSTD